jgi:hypothetical protein
MGRGCSKHGVGENAYKMLVGNPVRKTTLGRPRHRWEHNITANLKKKVRVCGLDLPGLDRDWWHAFANFMIPQEARNYD